MRRARGPRPAAALLLLLAAAACGSALPADQEEDQARCPGYFQLSESATRLEFTASIPEEHLQTIFTPERFSEILTAVVDGLDLQAIRVVSNVTIGGFGESTEVPLSTPSGGSLGDPAVQYPWRGQAVLSLGAVTGPFFGMDAIQAMTGANASEQAARSPAAAMRTSYDELVMPDPAPEAIAVMRDFNAAQVAAAAGADGGAPPVLGTVDEMSLVQVLACNGSQLQLVFRDVAPLTSGLAEDAVSLQDLRQREPELGKLFSDAVTSDTDLETSPPLVTRRQYWPLLLNDGQSAGFLMSAVEFRTQRDAVAGKDAIRGVMRVMTMTSQHPFRPYYATLPDAAVQDIQTLMTALQQDL